jgi:hypothetical protein
MQFTVFFASLFVSLAFKTLLRRYRKQFTYLNVSTGDKNNRKKYENKREGEIQEIRPSSQKGDNTAQIKSKWRFLAWGSLEESSCILWSSMAY